MFFTKKYQVPPYFHLLSHELCKIFTNIHFVEHLQMGASVVPPKLIKLFFKLLTKAINMSKILIVFPQNSVTASMIPLDKGKPNRKFNFKFKTSEFIERVFQDLRKKSSKTE